MRAAFWVVLGLTVGCGRASGPPVVPQHAPPNPMTEPVRAQAKAARLPQCPATAPLSPGSLGGTLRTPSQRYPISGAGISLLNPAGATVATTSTDGCGRFGFTGVQPGPYTVRYGVRNLGGMMPFTAPASLLGAIPTLGLPIPKPPILIDPPIDIAPLRAGVVHGVYDDVEGMLDKVGIPYTVYDAEDLKESAPYQHRMLFIACGAATYPDDDELKKRLNDYVMTGGSLYVSDLAVSYVGETFPGAVKYSYENRGSSGTRKAYVLDPVLKGAVKNQPTIDITYDMGGWQRLDVDQPQSTQTPLRDTETDEPLTVAFTVGAGLVQYTTFHEEPQTSEGQELALVYMITRM